MNFCPAPVADPCGVSLGSRLHRSRVRSSGSLAFGLCLAVLVLLAPFGDWVSFPLGAAVRGEHIEWEIDGFSSVSTSLIYWGLTLSAIALMPIHRVGSLILASASLAFLLLVFFRVALFEPEWLWTYVRESSERVTFASYGNNQFIANRSVEPTFVPVREFETLEDQLTVAVAMLGWGFYLALAASLGVLFQLAVLSDPATLLPATLLPACGLVFGFVMLGGFHPLKRMAQAELDRRQADRWLVEGRGLDAVGAYARATQSNANLAGSRPLLQKVAMAYDALSRGRDPLGGLASDLTSTSGRDRVESTEPIVSARRRLIGLRDYAAPAVTGLEAPLLTTGATLTSELWTLEGLVHARQGHPASAISAYDQATPRPDSLHRFYPAHADLELGDPTQALDVVPSLLETVKHPTLAADLLSTMGDAHTVDGDLKKARDAYVQSRELDRTDNYRVVRALSGG